MNNSALKNFFSIMCAALVWTVLSTLPAAALNQTDIKWRILKTPNFEIYFHNRDDEFARSAGVIAENALRSIGRDLNIGKLHGRIPLVMHDFSDSSYGFTNILQNKVWVSIAQPEAAEQSDRTWIESVIRHELTHYLMGTKFDRKLKLGTGRIIGWGILPMWFIEGVAQREESSWNAIKDSAVRTALLSRRFFDLKELQIFYFFNYHGRRLGYHIGNSLVNFIAEKFGPESIPAIIGNVNFSINGFNRAVRKVTKKSMGEIFQMWQEEKTRAYEARVGGKKSVNDMAKPWTDHNGMNISPDFAAGGVYYLSNRGRDARRFSICRFDEKTGARELLVENAEDYYHVTAGGEKIYFCRKTRDPHDYVLSDVFVYDAAHKVVDRVTRWKRVENPVFCEATGDLFAVVNEAGTTNICRIDEKGDIAGKLTEFRHDSAVYDLQTAKGATGECELFFNYFHAGRFSVASIVCDQKSPDYKKVTIIATSDAMILHPRVVALGDKNYRAYVVREDDGLLNVHSFDFTTAGSVRTSECVPVTDFRESVLDFDVDAASKKLVVVTPTASGSQITLLDSFPAVAKADCAPDAAAGRTSEVAAAKPARAKFVSPLFTFEKFKEDKAGAKPVALADPDIRAFPAAAEDAKKGPAGLKAPEVLAAEANGFKISEYRSRPRLEYMIPMAGSQSSKSLYGAQGRVADPTNRHTADFQALVGTGRYRSINGTYTYRGFKPTIGLTAYDMVRDLRPGVLENVKGVDLFASYRAFDSSVTASVFDRRISANSISPLLELRNPALSTGERSDRGYSLRLVNSEADNTVDSDIHPVNAHYLLVYHQNSTGSMDSFFKYKINRIDFTKWILLDEKKNTTLKLRVAGGVASGDYDFQVGGYGDLRGYGTTTQIGKYMQLYSVEYSHKPIIEPVRLRMLSVNKVYPAVFFDIGTVYFDGAPKTWYRSAGVELRARLLLFRKTPIVGRIGVAERLTGRRFHETYTAFELRF